MGNRTFAEQGGYRVITRGTDSPLLVWIGDGLIAVSVEQFTGGSHVGAEVWSQSCVELHKTSLVRRTDGSVSPNPQCTVTLQIWSTLILVRNTTGKPFSTSSFHKHRHFLQYIYRPIGLRAHLYTGELLTPAGANHTNGLCTHGFKQ